MHRPINDGDEKVLRVEPNVPISFSNGGIVDWPKCARGRVLFQELVDEEKKNPNYNA